MTLPLKLIVGLGNPGPKYEATRHNAGVWLIELLAEKYLGTLRQEPKFQSLFTRVQIQQQECCLLFPLTYMNNSGQAVQAAANFYKLTPEEILIAHDELDLPTGTVRLKQDGGHGGHNGLRSIIDHLGSKSFLRCRLGVGRPPAGEASVDYVLNKPSRAERELIDQTLAQVMNVIPLLLTGERDKAMQQLHTKE